MLSLLMMGMADAQTHLWGTCQYGGIITGSIGGTRGCGTIFMADINGNNLTTAYLFDSTNGSVPLGNLVLAPNGKIYGVTAWGGCADSCIIFEYNPITKTSLDVYDFYCKSIAALPSDGMILGLNANLYGLTFSGGSNECGLIYRFNPGTKIFDTLYCFKTLTGKNPNGRLLLMNNKFYGTTCNGGANDFGAIFCFDLSTLTYTDLHDFNYINGANPRYGNLVSGNDGKLYGTTSNGGTDSCGVIFSFDTSGNEFSVIHNFDIKHGSYPYGSLLKATDGKLYGMTTSGGSDSAGVIYSYNPSNSVYTDLFDFDKIHGANPQRSLMQASTGLLFGTTTGGGTYNEGVSFSYNISSNTYSVLFNFDGTKNGSLPDCDMIETFDDIECSCVLSKYEYQSQSNSNIINNKSIWRFLRFTYY